MSAPKHSIIAVSRDSLKIVVEPGSRGVTQLTVTSGAVTAVARLSVEDVDATAAALLKGRDVSDR